MHEHGGGHAATFEIFDEAQAPTIDDVEVGDRVNGLIRFATQVPDLDAAVQPLLAHGSTLIQAPVPAP